MIEVARLGVCAEVLGVILLYKLLVLVISFCGERWLPISRLFKLLMQNVFLLLSGALELFVKEAFFVEVATGFNLGAPSTVATAVTQKVSIRDGELHCKENVRDLFLVWLRVMDDLVGNTELLGIDACNGETSQSQEGTNLTWEST